MRILVACEFSGIVRDAFAKRGHDAWSCDLLPTEIPGNHIQGDALEILNDGWDLMIAHPPCTYLSVAGAVRLYPKKGELNQDRYKLGCEAKEFFISLLNAQINRIAIENPTPLTVYQLPKYDQVIQPYQYGHPYSKRTCLWLKGLPKLKPTDIHNGETISWVSGGSKKANGLPRENKGTKIRNAYERAKTFTGIAEAMAEQWGETNGN